MEEYASNSRTRRVEPEKEAQPEKKVEKIISGSASRRRKPLGRRFIETLFGGTDARGIWGYIAQDVLVPAAKSMIVDAVTGGVERGVYGDVRGRAGGSRAAYSGTSRVSYSGISRSATRDEPRRELSRRERASHDFDGIILDRRVDAEEVLDQMLELLSKYKLVSVADLYDLVGQRTTFVDQDWGWDDLRGADIAHINGGFLLNLPRPIHIG